MMDREAEREWRNDPQRLRDRIEALEQVVVRFEREAIKWRGKYYTARREALEEAARVCDARYMGDNNREDMEARRCAAAIRALKEKE